MWSKLRGARAAAPGGTPWWHVLGFEAGPPPSLGVAETRFRKLAAAAHPDRGGSVDAMQRLNRARAEARRALAVRDRRERVAAKA